MKKLFLFCVFLAFAFVANGTVALSGADIQIKPGESKQLEISLTNDVEFSGFQLDLVLPTGITVTGKSKKQKAQLTGILEELDYDYTVGPTAEGYFGIRVFSTEEGMTIEPSDGVVITVNIQAAEDMALGEREIKLTNIIISQDGNAVDLDDVIFKAQVVKTVTFSVSSADPTKGTVTDNSGTYNSGTSLTATAVPLDGYEFVNWTSGEDEVSKENPYVFTVTDDVSLTANFQAATYTITYHPGDGATFTTEKNSYTIESEDITLDEPTKTGYKFDGWYDNAEFTGDVVTQIAKGSTGNKEFYAKWTAETYTITYHGVDESFITTKTSYTIESDEITLDEPTKTGYKFDGWYDNAEFTGAAVTKIASGQTGDKEFYAKWTAETYTITYHPGDGATFTTEKNSYTIESEDIRLDEPTMTGYDFGGWYDNAEFTGEAITKIAKGSTGNKEFYAKWTAEIYTITYHGVDESFITTKTSYTIESGEITLDEPTKTGYKFDGWYDNAEFTGAAVTKIASGQTGDKEFYAKWTAETYTITYHPGDGATFTTEKNSYTIESEDITLDEPTMTGYDFGGWYDNAEFTGEAITKIAKGSTGNKEFFAKWTEASSIKALFRDSKAVNVYTVGGTLVGRDMTVGEVLQLKRGIYVINGKKIVVK